MNPHRASVTGEAGAVDSLRSQNQEGDVRKRLEVGRTGQGPEGMIMTPGKQIAQHRERLGALKRYNYIQHPSGECTCLTLSCEPLGMVRVRGDS